MPLPLLPPPPAASPPAQVAAHGGWGQASAGFDLGPPADPGNEPRLASDTSGVAKYCERLATKLSRSGEQIIRSVTSRNLRYGVVWRADVSAGDGDPDRIICWWARGTAGPSGYQFVVRPLRMFNPAESIGPLAPAAPKNPARPPG